MKDVFTAITFEVAYSLGKHVLTGHEERDMPALTPVLRWRKGNKIAVRNEVKHIVKVSKQSFLRCYRAFQVNNKKKDFYIATNKHVERSEN